MNQEACRGGASPSVKIPAACGRERHAGVIAFYNARD